MGTGPAGLCIREDDSFAVLAYMCGRLCSVQAESPALESVFLGVKLASALISFTPHVSPCSANRASYSIICNCKSPRALETRGFFFFFVNLAQIHLAAEPGPAGGRLSTVFSFQVGTVLGVSAGALR